MNAHLPRPAVCHLVAPAPYGGLESVLQTLAPAQVEAGHEVTVLAVFAADPSGEPFWESLVRSGVTAAPLVLPGRQYAKERAEVRRVLERTGADILHTHGYRPDVIDAPVARTIGVKTVTTVHGFTGGSFRNRVYEWIQRRAFRRFDAVVAVSERLRGELVRSGVSPDKVQAVRNAWRPSEPQLSRSDAREVLGLRREGPMVGWVGRLQPGKGPDVALRAFAGLPGEARLVFVGDGPAEASLRDEARSLGLADRVQFLGSVPGAGRYLRAFDVFVMSSWSEGTPMVILEAMAAGVPIVTTGVGGIPDVLSTNEAILTDAGDVDAIARGVESVLQAPEVANRRARAARDRLDRDLAVEPWVERYHAIYEGCLDR